MAMTDVVRVALRRLATVRGRTLRNVREVNTATQDGTLAAGRHLQKVVEIARGTIAQLGSVLSGGGTSNGVLVTSIEQLSAHTRQHSDAMRAAVSNNLAQIAVVSEQLKTITRAAREVELLNAAARILSLNARIEASRQTGSSGSGNAFKAIAAEMQQLSRAISSANTQITDLAAAMERTLPGLEREGRALSDMVDEFAVTVRERIATVDEQISDLQSTVQGALAQSDQALGEVVSASHHALSELQFQDVCAQKLLLIDRELGEAHREVAQTLGGTADEIAVEVEPAAYETLGDDVALAPNAGEFMMF
jgi:hypothetical protein